MRQAPVNIQALIEPAVATLGYELVGVEYLSQGRHSLVRIYIDSEDGVTLDDCERVSHQVSGILDVEDVIHGQYSLEVSSPGLDRPLFSMNHFKRFIGKQVKIRLSIPMEGRRNFSGVIRDAGDNHVVLEVDTQEIELPFNAIEKANLVPKI
ncbi:MAG: ribosome maturation factor RimP [Gammaproteobacteria bacterium]|nr:ribosome maturation factor RimP [Gammaproteobacteria bacterium]